MTKQKKKFSPFAPTAKSMAIAAIVISIFAVVLSLIIRIFYNPADVAERKFEFLAKDYYENYYYEKFVATAGDDLDAAFERYANYGFAPVRLRQLLLFDGGRNESYEKYFNLTSYKCDTNASSVTYYPEAPFGKTNYRVVYNLSCAEE